MSTPRPDTEEGVVNLALGHLHEPGIALISEDTVAARTARKWFGAARDAVLRRYPWNFAKSWCRPAADVTDSLGPLVKRYPLPPDCVGVQFVKDLGTDEWDIEGGTITDVSETEIEATVLVSNSTAPIVCYTRRVEAVRLWDAMFVTCFALELAAAMSGELGHAELGPSLRAQWQAELDETKRADAQEKARGEVSRDTSWILSRV